MISKTKKDKVEYEEPETFPNKSTTQSTTYTRDLQNPRDRSHTRVTEGTWKLV